MKKKVRFKTSVSGVAFTYRPGDEAYLDARIADAWVKAEMCDYVEEKTDQPKR